MQNQWILVTGASGFIGASLCEALLAEGYKVVGVGRRNAYDKKLSVQQRGFLPHSVLENPNFKYECLELKNLNINSLRNYEFSLAFHLASMVEYASHDYHDYHDYTITPVVNLIEFAQARGIKRIVFSSTLSIFSHDSSKDTPISETSPINPRSLYALAKYSCEKLFEFASLKNQELEIICLRFPAVCGINHLGGFVYEFAKKALYNEDIELYANGSPTRNVLYVADAVHSLLLAQKVSSQRLLSAFECFIIGSADSLSTREIALTLIDELNSHSRIILSPIPSPNPFNSMLCTSKAQQILGFIPKPLALGLRSYALAIKEQGAKL